MKLLFLKLLISLFLIKKKKKKNKKIKKKIETHRSEKLIKKYLSGKLIIILIKN